MADTYDFSDFENDDTEEKVEFDFSNMELPEPAKRETIGAGEAALRGAEQGLTLGFADELGAPFGAIPEAITTEANPDESKLGQIKRLYKEYRDSNRDRYEAAERAQPGAFTAGAMAGGVLTPIPGGAVGAAGKTAAKVLSGGDKIGKALKSGAKVGGTIGAGLGAGMSEAELLPEQGIPELGELGKDIAFGSFTGAGLGAGLSGVAQSASSAAKGIKDSNFSQKLMDAYKRAKGGQKVVGEQAEVESTKLLRKEAENMINAIKSQEKITGQELESVLQRAEKEGITIDVSKELNQSISNLEKLATETEFPMIESNAKEMIGVLKNALKGKQGIVGYKPKFQAPKVGGEEKALQRAQEIEAKGRLKSPEAEAGARAEKQATDIMLKEQEQYKALVRGKLEEAGYADEAVEMAESLSKGSPAESMGIPNAIAEDIAKIKPPSKFGPGELKVQEDTGRSAIQMIDEASGNSVVKTLDDIDLVNAERITDDATGLEFYRIFDKDSGRVSVVPVKEVEKLYTPITAVRGRKGATGEMLPTKAQDFKETLSEFTPAASEMMHKRVQPHVTDIVEKVRNKITAEVPESKGLLNQYHNLLNARERLGIKGVKEAQASDKVAALVAKLDDGQMSGYEALIKIKDAFGFLEKASPETSQTLKPFLDEAVTRYQMAHKGTGSFGVAATSSGVPVGRAGGSLETIPYQIGQLAGSARKAVGDIASAATPDAIKSAFKGASRKVSTVEGMLSKITNIDIPQLAQQVRSMGSKESETLAGILENAKMHNRRSRHSLMFGIMQNPVYRSILEEATKRD